MKKFDNYDRKSDMATYNMARSINDKIGSFSLPTDILFIPTINFSGSVYRFRLAYKNYPKDIQVSVYLDAYENLGCYNNEVYWEIYPDVDGDCSRYKFESIQDVVDDAIKSIRSRARDFKKDEIVKHKKVPN